MRLRGVPRYGPCVQHVEVTQRYDRPVGEVYAHLSEHENLGPVFGARVTRVRDGDDTRNGVGSVRRLSVPPLPPFEETVTRYEPDRLLEYRISSPGGLVRDHSARVQFTPDGDASTVTWHVDFRTAVPVLAPVVRLLLARSMRRGLADALSA